MESSPGENGEELTGRKKSRFKQLKTRLFGKLKKKESEGLIKQSQSASDITAPKGRREGYDSEDEFTYPQCLSSRALSHDSIFLSDQSQSTEPTRVLSQENVHGKIKALQLKLQQQNLHLGPPPMLIPGKRTEDSGTTSEDDGLPCSPPETCFHEAVMRGAVYKYPESLKHLSSLSLTGTGSEEEEQGDPMQPSSRPLSPVSKPFFQPIISSVSITPTAGIDFSSPAGYMPRLDNSAARHRMSVKPRNQRASTRGNRAPAVSISPRHRSESISDLGNVLSEEEDDETMTATETAHHLLYSSPTLELKEHPISPEPAAATPLKPVQIQENLNKTETHFQSLGAEILKSEESLEPEGRVTMNPLYLQSMSFGSGPSSPSSGPPESPQREIESSRDHSPFQRHDTNDTQSENLVAKESIQEEASLRLYPVPIPRVKNPKMDIKNPPSPKGAAESGSFQFLLASAKNRSKATSDTLTKTNEGQLKASPGIKNKSNKLNLELHKDEARETKATEFQNLLHQTQNTKSFHREVIPPIMSKPTAGSYLQKTDTSTEHVETEKLEEPEDRRNDFGVQLRTTSQSLRYRSEVSKIKDETKRYSLESNTVQAVSKDHAGKTETFRNNMCDSNSKSKSSAPKKQDSQCLEPLLAAQDNGRPSIQTSTGTSKEAVSEPGWMSLAREKTRAYQPFLGKLASNPSPVHPSPPTAPPAQPPRPALQPKTQSLTTAPHPLKTQYTLNTPMQTASQQTSQRPTAKSTLTGTKEKQDKVRNSTAEDDTKKAAATSKMDGNARPVPPNNTEALTVTSEPTATSPSSSSPPDVSQPQQSRSDGAQPSWMELAKRKSLAWSDKSLE